MEKILVTYLVWKTIHIVSVVLFIGNITTGLFWAAQARKSGDLEELARTFRTIGKSDRWFTIPAVLGILVSGVAAAQIAQLPLLRTGWILWSLMLFAVSGIIFSVWIAPLQRQLARMARAGDTSEEAWTLFRQTYLKWELWGLAALLTPAAALVIMVIKPALPGF